MEEKEPGSQPESVVGKDKKSTSKRFAIAFAVVALILAGLLGWLWMNSQNAKKDLQDRNKKLQNQVEELKKQAADDKSHAESEESADSCPDATDAFRDTIADAVASKNYAALEASMTDPVTVVYAATEFGGPRTPAEAVGDMAYLNDAAAPWDFDLPEATVDGYRAGFYEQYFPEGAYVGKSNDGRVVSFAFECGQIKQIFIAAHEDLL